MTGLLFAAAISLRNKSKGKVLQGTQKLKYHFFIDYWQQLTLPGEVNA